jgi:hypothetical protein
MNFGDFIPPNLSRYLACTALTDICTGNYTAIDCPGFSRGLSIIDEPHLAPEIQTIDQGTV